MSKAAELKYITAEDLLSAAEKVVPHVDIDLGGAFMRVSIAADYEESEDLGQRRRELLALIRDEKECPQELRPYRKRSDDAILTAALLSYSSLQPALSIEQSFRLLKDGVTVRMIKNAIQQASVAHLLEVAKKRIEAGKKDSATTPSTGSSLPTP